MESPREQFQLTKASKILMLGNLLKKIEVELCQRDLTSVPTEKAIDMSIKLSGVLDQEAKALKFVGTTDILDHGPLMALVSRINRIAKRKTSIWHTRLTRRGFSVESHDVHLGNFSKPFFQPRARPWIAKRLARFASDSRITPPVLMACEWFYRQPSALIAHAGLEMSWKCSE